MMPSREERVKMAYDEEFLVLDMYGVIILEAHLKEDASKDLTSKAVLKQNKTVHGIIKAKEDGILAGIEDIAMFYARHGILTRMQRWDGNEIKKGDIIAELEGDEKEFLKLERTGLNILQRMSGIATHTKKLADMVKPYNTKVVGTRKTLLNYLDKKAIKIGGGLPHRMGLYDAILIKDNHLSAIKEEGIEDVIEEAIERAYATRNKYHPKFIEIEITNVEEAVRAAEKYRKLYEHILAKKWAYGAEETPFIIMFDNMKPAAIKKAVNELKKQGLYDYVLLEASGGINEKNIKQYARSGVDTISVGWITHSVKALDISQKIVRREV